ncbi:hypothetical protein SAMN05192581_103747 [Bacteroides ovatus]|uniref:DEAD/DEAH-box helicase domain-containing protein n=1 Tax=Bacteroides ovatus TaxID=28116 RepID=A0A1G6G8G1_BACOV|nr:hypothetical protein [Bacteroides ovatus]SDB78282.1 hypothetical protein SAMN05192581_103747 [Bacteroides ovatus]
MSKEDELAKEIAGLDSSFIDELYNLQIPDEKTNLSGVITLGTTPVSEEHSKEVKSSIVENQIEETVPNTYGDLHDAPVEYIGEGAGIKTIPQDTVITSLDNLLFGRPPEVIREEVGDSFWNLADFIDKMPHGIVDKKIPGIGATTLEINSKRNSIIVFPTKALAYGKHSKHPNTLYVGSEIKGQNEKVTNQRIEEYLAKDGYKKLLVVADSLGRLLGIIGKENYKDYFLMVDEIDVLQTDNNFRPQLENVIDYYLIFPKKNRCMVTATMKEFSNPHLKTECRFPITWQYDTHRNIDLLHTDNITQAVIEKVISHPKEKVFIAYNSILQIRNIISSLDEETRKECAILCSEASIKEAGEYFAPKLGDNDTLPAKINFATCCYFTGIDIDDSYHLITVSDVRRSHSMLTIDRMTQIHGRCRKDNGILSETIIYNTLGYVSVMESMEKYTATLLNKAQKVLKVLESADTISQGDYTLTDLFAIIKEAIREKAQERIAGNELINLIRQNVDGEYVPAYFNIDYIIERTELYASYFMPETLKEVLGKQVKIISYTAIPHEDVSPEQSSIEKANKDAQNKLTESYIQEAIDNIKVLSTTGQLNDNTLYSYTRHCRSKTKIFLERFVKLYKYVDLDSLLHQLWEIRTSNNIAYKNLNNAVMYWALEKEHPFKIAIRRSFTLNKSYSASEIQEILAPIVQYHLHKVLKPRKYVALLRSIYATDRTSRNKYTIREENPRGFKEHTGRIATKENNLLKYFTFH